MLKNETLKGLSAAYVDDLLRAGDCDFRNVSNRTSKRFKMSDDFSFPDELMGFRLDRTKAGELVLNQKHYLTKLERLPQTANLSQFRSAGMKLAWLSNSRPDCCL